MRILLACAAAIALCGCPGPSTPRPQLPVRVVVSVFPLAEWTRAVVGSETNRVSTFLIADRGVDMHSRQPTAGDIARILDCDLFIHVGGVSDGWVRGLFSDGRTHPGVLDALSVVGADAKLVPCGKEHAHDEHDGHHHHADEKDEHIWMSLRLARRITSAIAERIAALDPVRADVYRANAAEYNRRLEAVDSRFAAAFRSLPRREIVIPDRFPLRYLASDYDIVCHAAFPGCSAESEAGFRTVAFLAQKIRELHPPCVFVIEGSRSGIADTAVKASGISGTSVETIDSMQGGGEGLPYPETMERNLEAILRALR